MQPAARSRFATWAARLCFGVPPVVLGVFVYQLTAGHRTTHPATQRAAPVPASFEAERWVDPIPLPAPEPIRAPESVETRVIARVPDDEPDPLDEARVQLAAADPSARREGVAGLASVEGDAVVPELMLAALHDPDARVREEAVRAVAEIAPDSAAPVLGRALADPDEGVRRAALAELGELDAPGAERVLRAAASDGRNPMRAMAAEVLADK